MDHRHRGGGLRYARAGRWVVCTAIARLVTRCPQPRPTRSALKKSGTSRLAPRAKFPGQRLPIRLGIGSLWRVNVTGGLSGLVMAPDQAAGSPHLIETTAFPR